MEANEFDRMSEEQLMTLLNEKLNKPSMRTALDVDAVREKQKEIDEINNIAAKIDAARKMDVEDTSSAAKKQLEKMRQMDKMMNTDITKNYLKVIKNTNMNYDLDYNALLEVNIYDVMKDKEHDSAWLLDFVKCAVKTVTEQENNTFRMINGKCERTFKETKANVRRAVVKVLNLNETDYLHKKFIKLIEYVLDYNKAKSSSGATPFVIEQDLKRELLGMNREEMKDLFKTYDVDDIINYNIVHCVSYDEAKKILNAVKNLVMCGYDLKDLENLNETSDWVKELNDFVEKGKDKNEEEFELDPEFDPFNDDEINEIENKYLYGKKCRGKDVEKKRVENISNSLKGKTNAAKAIVIRNKKGEIYEFENKTDCMNFLNTSSATFSKFLKGQSKLNKIFDVMKTN